MMRHPLLLLALVSLAQATAPLAVAAPKARVVKAATAATPESIAIGLAARLADTSENGLAYGLVRDLTTEIGPRLAGTDAEKRAADWAMARFKALGIDTVWTEPFTIKGWQRGIERAEITAPSPQPLVITALGNTPATPPEGIEAPIVLFPTYKAFIDAPADTVRGRIVVVTEQTVRLQDGGGYGAAGALRRNGPAEASRRGAVAYLLRSLGTHEHRFPHTGSTVFPEDVTPLPAAALSPPDAEQLERLVAKGEPVRLRLTLSPQSLGPVSSQNVIAEIRGREKPDEIILIGAHLDSWDLGTGAIDDGAGVAIVMAAAKMIRDLPTPPRRTVRIVLFGAEEPGLLGARAYVAAHKAALDKHVLATEADFGQGPVYRFSTNVADPAHPALERIRASLRPLGIIPGTNRAHGGPDIGPMQALGVPVVNLELDGTDYFDTHHTPDDVLNRIEPARISQTSAAYAIYTYLAAELEGDYRPTAAPQ
ncbi:M20/M25/M40 family metallo-hydrolase [Parapedomonas caeni]